MQQTVAILALLCGALTAQAAPQFEVVSVKPGDPHPTHGMVGAVDPTHWRAVNMGVGAMINFAYGFKSFSYDHIVGLPDWANTQLYDVEALMPPGTRRAQLPLMVQAMLADRFRLVTHLENRPMTAAALTVAPGGPKLKRDAACEKADVPVAVAPPPGAQRAGSGPGEPTPAPPCGSWATARRDQGADITYVYTFHGLTMTELASFAESQSLPVVDQTGIEGAYDFTLALPMMSGATARGMTTEQYEAADEDLQHARAEAYTQQLGLVLGRPKKLPVPVIVVEHIEKPTPD